MEKPVIFIVGMIRLWNINQYRENLYKQVMRLENLGTLRRICSHGYISSLLFKKEIEWVYDELQSSQLNVSQRFEQRSLPSIVIGATDKLSLTGILRKKEQKAIRIYHNIISGLNPPGEVNAILSDHLFKLKDLDYKLNKELMHSYEHNFSFPTGVVSHESH